MMVDAILFCIPSIAFLFVHAEEQGTMSNSNNNNNIPNDDDDSLFDWDRDVWDEESQKQGIKLLMTAELLQLMVDNPGSSLETVYADNGKPQIVFEVPGKRTVCFSKRNKDRAAERAGTMGHLGDVLANPRCRHCNLPGCVSTTLYDSMAALGTQMEQNDYSTKQIRYELYRFATREIHGVLGSGVRRKLPVCVIGDIQDLYPAPNREYTGFRDGNTTYLILTLLSVFLR